MNNRNLIILMLCFGVSAAGAVNAEVTSTNFKLGGQFTSGSADMVSTGYSVEGGAFTGFHQLDPSSTNFELGGSVEALSADGLAVLDSTSPGDFSRFFQDESADFTVTANDPDGEALNYKALQDGSTKAGPQASSNLTWALSAGDIGRRELEFQVFEATNPDGTVTKKQSMFVFRRPLK